MSDLICNLQKQKTVLLWDAAQNMILKNNHIPHISLFISAPFSVRVEHINGCQKHEPEAGSEVPEKKWTDSTEKYYQFYTGEKWGKNRKNYDLCINSANYGIKETIDVIRRMIGK